MTLTYRVFYWPLFQCGRLVREGWGTSRAVGCMEKVFFFYGKSTIEK